MDMDTDEYSGSADPLKTAASTVNQAMRSLESSLSGTHAMAGDDTGGQDFAKSYDASAKDAVQAGCALGEALGKMGVLIKHAAHNHAAADAASSIKPKAAPTKPDASVEKVSPTTPPSAVGGTGDEPEWWHYVVSHLGGLLWPDADTGALRRAGTAWSDAASKVDQASSYISEAQGKAALAESPENGSTQNALTTLQDQVSSISSAMRQVGQQCSDYAQHVDETHEQTKQIGEDLAWELGISTGVGIGLTVVTAGASDLLAAGADALEIANAASRIASFLRRLSEMADAASAAFRAQSGPLKLADKALNTFRTAEPKVAKAASAVSKAKAIEDVPVRASTSLQSATKTAHAASEAKAPTDVAAASHATDASSTVTMRVADAEREVSTGRRAATEAERAEKGVARDEVSGPPVGTSAEVRGRWQKYLARKAAAGQRPRTFRDWLPRSERALKNKIKGDARRDQVMEHYGLRAEDGWMKERGPDEDALRGLGRRWDITHRDERIGVEVKSGSSPERETLVQLSKDEKALRAGWRLQWHLKDELSPRLMARLEELKRVHPDRFSYKIEEL